MSNPGDNLRWRAALPQTPASPTFQRTIASASPPPHGESKWSGHSQPDSTGGAAADPDLHSDASTPSPFEIFIAQATGVARPAASARGAMGASAVMMVRRRAAVALGALAVMVVVWLVHSFLGSGGMPMDPELPFAAGVQSADDARIPRDGDGEWPQNRTAASAGAQGSQAERGSASIASGGAGSHDVLVVHVAGAVNLPGVHRLDSGARVHDAVTAAGGPRPDADLNRLNLAGPVVDGAWIYVLAVGETAPPAPGGGGASPPSGAPQGQTISLSSASESELQTLPGIGPSTAAAIVAHRTANGPFRSVDQLLDVRGIGPAKLEAIRDLVVP